MGQFSVEKPVAPGSVLSGNQQREPLLYAVRGVSEPETTFGRLTPGRCSLNERTAEDTF
jgi:hypothetical protein